MEEGVNNEDDDKKEITEENEDEGEIHRDIKEYKKENNRDALDKVITECPDNIFPPEMEKYVNDKVYDDNEKNDEKKEENETTYSISTNIDEVKGVNDERGD